MRSRLSKLGLMTMAAVLAVALCGAVFASWTDDLVVQGQVETGEVNLVIEGTSETIVYKDLDDSSMIVWTTGDDPVDPVADNLLEVAKAYVSDYDVDGDTATIVFEDIFPGPLFCADLLVHYYGVPGHVSVESFTVSPSELQPYVWWEIVWPDDTTDTGGGQTVTPTFAGDDFYQLHECQTFKVNIYCQIPQDMSLVDMEGSVSMRLAAEQFNECTPEVNKVLDLPDEPLTMTLEGTYSPTLDSYGDPRSYFDAFFDVPAALEADYGWLEAGPWPAWCCEFENSTNLGPIQVTLMSTIGMPAWEPINYLLNQPQYLVPSYNYDGLNMTVGGFSGVKTHSARQRAYWHYQPDSWAPPAADLAQDLITDANANSAGFIPGSGQLAAVVCQSSASGYQTVFVEIDP